jgi:hypothetical protein
MGNRAAARKEAPRSPGRALRLSGRPRPYETSGRGTTGHRVRQGLLDKKKQIHRIEATPSSHVPTERSGQGPVPYDGPKLAT